MFVTSIPFWKEVHSIAKYFQIGGGRVFTICSFKKIVQSSLKTFCKKKQFDHLVEKKRLAFFMVLGGRNLLLRAGGTPGRTKMVSGCCWIDPFHLQQPWLLPPRQPWLSKVGLAKRWKELMRHYNMIYIIYIYLFFMESVRLKDTVHIPLVRMIGNM